MHMQMPTPVIVEASFTEDHGFVQAEGLFDDGSVKALFNFYIDELSFSCKELVGKTHREAQELHLQRDQAYLRS